MPAYVYKFVKKDKPHSLKDMKWEVIIKKDEYPNIPQWIIDESDDYGDSYHLPLRRVKIFNKYVIQLEVPFSDNIWYRTINYNVKVGQDVSDLLGLKNEDDIEEDNIEEELSEKDRFKQMLKEVIQENLDEVKDWLFYGRFDK